MISFLIQVLVVANPANTNALIDLGNLVAAIQASGADIVKIATTAVDITDVARVFQITVHSQVSGVSRMPCLAVWLGIKYKLLFLLSLYQLYLHVDEAYLSRDFFWTCDTIVMF